jgi:hypothetical protein
MRIAQDRGTSPSRSSSLASESAEPAFLKAAWGLGSGWIDAGEQIEPRARLAEEISSPTLLTYANSL